METQTKQSSTMESQVGRIIANALLKSQTIFLPELGSLELSTLTSQIKGSNITPPRRVVKFSKEQSALSLVDILSTQCGCELEAAEEIYAQWLQSARCQGGADIEGVGRIVNMRFNVASSFDAVINPEVYKSLKLKRRRSGVVWIAASVLGCVVVGLVANFAISKFFASKPAKVTPQQEVVEVAVESPAEEIIEVVEPTPEPTPVVSQNPRHRVVYGVFSTMENAQRGVALAQSLSGNVTPEIRSLGKMFMVSIFSSDNEEECRSFKARYEAECGDLWIHTRRGE